MEKDIIAKIQSLLDRGASLNEDEVRSLMILIRKRLELMSEAEKKSYLILYLFCNWSAHVAIDKSITGLEILAQVNDALVSVKDSADNHQTTLILSKAIGLKKLRLEMQSFFEVVGIEPRPDDQKFEVIIKYILEIIRDVPITFPLLTTLGPKQRKIYDRISKNPIKTGAGVVSLKLSLVDYSALGFKDIGIILCLLIQTEDTTTINVPFNIEAL